MTGSGRITASPELSWVWTGRITAPPSFFWAPNRPASRWAWRINRVIAMTPLRCLVAWRRPAVATRHLTLPHGA